MIAPGVVTSGMVVRVSCVGLITRVMDSSFAV